METDTDTVDVLDVDMATATQPPDEEAGSEAESEVATPADADANADKPPGFEPPQPTTPHSPAAVSSHGGRSSSSRSRRAESTPKRRPLTDETSVSCPDGLGTLRIDSSGLILLAECQHHVGCTMQRKLFKKRRGSTHRPAGLLWSYLLSGADYADKAAHKDAITTWGAYNIRQAARRSLEATMGSETILQQESAQRPGEPDEPLFN